MSETKDFRPIKKKLRNESKEYRLSLSQDEKARLDKKISNKFLNMWQYRQADVILIYVSMPIEVDTFEIIHQALLDKKRVAVPRCVDGTRNMDFYFIKDVSDLASGTFGVLEPDPEKCEKLSDFSHGLCIVPALCYDKTGYRVGYGGGYYDRFLCSFGGETLGICYNNCIKENVPHGKYDLKVDKILTESKIIIT